MIEQISILPKRGFCKVNTCDKKYINMRGLIQQARETKSMSNIGYEDVMG